MDRSPWKLFPRHPSEVPDIVQPSAAGCGCRARPCRRTRVVSRFLQEENYGRSPRRALHRYLLLVPMLRRAERSPGRGWAVARTLSRRPSTPSPIPLARVRMADRLPSKQG